jgi:hypothetical protein
VFVEDGLGASRLTLLHVFRFLTLFIYTIISGDNTGNCCTVLIACVSPAENNVDESINTLRYAERSMSITNVVKQNVVQEALSPAECAALQAENKRLKANILQLQKRMVVDESKRSTSNLLDGGLSQDERSVDAGLSGLQAKLEMAKIEAKEAREHSRSVASTAGRWRDHFETMAKSSKVSPCVAVARTCALIIHCTVLFGIPLCLRFNDLSHHSMAFSRSPPTTTRFCRLPFRLSCRGLRAETRVHATTIRTKV